MRIDAHHHLWTYDPVEYDWIDDNMAVIAKDFGPDALTKTLEDNGLDGAIAVQARQTIEETHWLLSLADKTPEMLGVVGWVDLRANDINEQLEALANQSKLVGFRHVIQGETDPGFMANPAFIRGLKALEKHNFCYDLLIFAHQLPAAISMLQQVPELPVVVDHIAKPNIKTGEDFDTWAHDMRTIASLPGVFCKVSGMITEADWENWQPQQLTRYLDVIFDAFGWQRIMFGSDWPVCLVAGEYSQVKSIVTDYITALSPEQQAAVLGNNAKRFYQIK